MIKFIPAKLLGSIVRVITSISSPKFLVRFFCKSFAKKYKIDTSQISRSIDEYNSLLDFFIREPAPGARPICQGENEIASPVDALVTAIGKAEKDKIILVKNHFTSFNNLIQNDFDEYIDGAFVMLYLSPGDFHRIYSPCDGKVTRSWFIDGKLMPVYPEFTDKNPQTFCKNKRVITELESNAGKILVIKVGALNVGRIPVNHSLPYSPGKNKHYKKGEEIGRFEFGSTVILLFQNECFNLANDLNHGDKVKIGQAIASFSPKFND